MRIHSRPRGQSGFTLIEVMIAVIVLATGLLALAALQINLTSSSADAKARSRIAALLVSTLDDERAAGYGCIQATMTCTSASCSPAPATGCPAYTYATDITTAQNEAGVSGLGLSMTAATVGTYKNIALNATWTDATGGSRTLGVNTIASAMVLSGSSTLLSQNLSGSGGISPVAREGNPGNTAGVIPIAVGSNENAAATNPTPNINHFTLPSTTFNVLTFSQGVNDTSATSTIQKRVETTVAECVCKGGLAISDTFLGRSMFRPTYWNGLKYSSPLPVFNADGTTLTPPYSSNVTSVTQDGLCTQCCRDHHDASADVVKFDPFTGDLSRYQVKLTGAAVTVPVALKTTNGLAASTANPPLVANTAADNYLDSCRLIRVDGLWRVAADLNAEQTGLLATTAKGFATSPVPDPSAATAYADFVVDYLGQKLTQFLSSGPVPVANSVFASHGLDDPANIDATTVAGDYRFLHGRGLYLDHLEQPALDKLNAVNSTCAVANYPTCLLPFLPFNTINVTELANWVTADITKLTVTNASTSCTTIAGVPAPIRGCVKGVAVSAASLNATISMTHSNSAVASSLQINPYELLAANVQTDAQAFKVTGTDTASEFFVAISGLAQLLDLSTSDDPSVTWGVGANSDFCFSGFANRNDTNPSPYDCVSTVALAVPVSVILGSYNVVTNQPVANPCAGGTGTFSQPMLTCSTVTAASVSGPGTYTTSLGVSGTAKTAGEQTTISITGTPATMVKSASTVNVTFGPNGSKTAVQDGLGTGYTCDVLTFQPTFNTPTTCN